jgi:hypothetical protein
MFDGDMPAKERRWLAGNSTSQPSRMTKSGIFSTTWGNLL